MTNILPARRIPPRSFEPAATEAPFGKPLADFGFVDISKAAGREFGSCSEHRCGTGTVHPSA